MGPTGPEVHVSVDDLEAIKAERPPRPFAELTHEEALREVRRLREANAELQGEINALRTVLSDVLHLARPDAPQQTDE